MRNSTYHAYLLRLWREDPHLPWRAEIEDAHTGEKRRFGSPAQLLAFLSSLMPDDSSHPKGGDLPPQLE